MKSFIANARLAYKHSGDYKDMFELFEEEGLTEEQIGDLLEYLVKIKTLKEGFQGDEPTGDGLSGFRGSSIDELSLFKKIENIIYDDLNDIPYATKRIIKMLKEMGLI